MNHIIFLFCNAHFQVSEWKRKQKLSWVRVCDHCWQFTLRLTKYHKVGIIQRVCSWHADGWFRQMSHGNSPTVTSAQLMDSWCANNLFFFFQSGSYGYSISAKMLLCCHGDKSSGRGPRSPWGLILLWLGLCSVLLLWFHTVILILLSSLLLTHCHLCLHSHLHPLHISHPKSSPFPRPLPDSDSLSSPTRLSLSDGSEDQLDRLQQVELARMTPMSQWRAGTVQAWLEVVMAMPMYIRSCSENVKSGKVGQSGRLTNAAPPLLLLLQQQLKLWRFAGFTWADRWRPGAGFRCQQPNASPKTPAGHRGLQRGWKRWRVRQIKRLQSLYKLAM